MFAGVSSEIAVRRLSAQRMISLIEQLELASDTGTAAICKGFAFVQLYATYEFAVRASVQATLAGLRAAGLEIRSLRRELLALVLDPQWESASSSGRGRMWECRIALMSHMDAPELTSGIDDSLFPRDGSHYRVRQLQTIWRIFAITEPVVADTRYLGRIEEFVENRNAISHGRRTPEDVGRRFSRQEIADRVIDTDAICNHIVGVLEAHLRMGRLVASGVGT